MLLKEKTEQLRIMVKMNQTRKKEMEEEITGFENSHMARVRQQLKSSIKQSQTSTGKAH